MNATTPFVTQVMLCLSILALMVLAGVKKRRLELRSLPVRRFRWREWRHLRHR